VTIDIRPAGSRFHTEFDWLDSWHSFSFGNHYDPANTHHGLLLVHNDDIVEAAGGFGTHPHRDMEIVTWVLDGALEHRDSIGTRDVITPGLAQRMSAGTGIRHSEMNASRTEPVHLLQMWVIPDTPDLPPSYEQQDVSELYAKGGMFPLASGREPDAAIHIHQRDATLWIARLDGGQAVTVPDAPFVHVFVARGALTLDSATLGAGDAARLEGAGTLTMTAGTDGAELTVWEMYSSIDPNDVDDECRSAT
jgi:redox-sensitive bicupin YhaK (pirin superfamily)